LCEERVPALPETRRHFHFAGVAGGLLVRSDCFVAEEEEICASRGFGETSEQWV
jgi:hypothetical protein